MYVPSRLVHVQIAARSRQRAVAASRFDVVIYARLRVACIVCALCGQLDISSYSKQGPYSVQPVAMNEADTTCHETMLES